MGLSGAKAFADAIHDRSNKGAPKSQRFAEYGHPAISKADFIELSKSAATIRREVTHSCTQIQKTNVHLSRSVAS